MSDTTFTPDDEGKQVITPDGTVLGRVIQVRDGAAYVAPKSNLLRAYGSWIASCWDSCEHFHLEDRQVAAVTEQAIILKLKTSDALPVSTHG